MGVQVWTLSPQGQLNKVFDADLTDTKTIPGSLHFIDNSNRDVNAFGVWDGSVLVNHQMGRYCAEFNSQAHSARQRRPPC